MDLCKNNSTDTGFGQQPETYPKPTGRNLHDLLKLSVKNFFPKKKNWTIVVCAQPLQSTSSTDTNTTVSSLPQYDHNVDKVKTHTSSSPSTNTLINPVQKESLPHKNLLHTFLKQTSNVQGEKEKLDTNLTKQMISVEAGNQADSTDQTTESISCTHLEEEIIYRDFEPSQIFNSHFKDSCNEDKALVVGRYACVVCKQELSSSSRLDVHLKSSLNAYEYVPCIVCDNIFLGPNELEAHMQNVHLGTSRFKTTCGVCGKVLKDGSRLEIHLLSHNNQTESSLCELCGKAMKTIKLKNHMNEMHPKTTLRCPHCAETFPTRSRLFTHKKKHLKPEDLEQYCEICGKKVKGKRLLKLHLFTHSSQRNFQCDTCGSAFKQYSTLAAHQRIHNGVFPYCCDKCSKPFRWKKTYDNHISKCQGSQDKPESD